jgi:voltage-gated potassium channel
LGIRGDSTKAEILREAGIERAKALIIALNEDPKTVFTALTAKELNPRVRIYARANRNDSKNKIRLAGADYVVCLPEIGGRELIRGLLEQKDE